MVELDLGMIFSRVCFHYGMSYRDCMDLPMRTFWMLNRNISRLLAEKDLRAISVALSAVSEEAAGALQTKLVEEFQNPYVMEHQDEQAQEPIEERRDEAGFAQLKMM